MWRQPPPTVMTAVSRKRTSLYNAIKTNLADLGITKDAPYSPGATIFVALIVICGARPATYSVARACFEVLNEVLDIFHWHAGAFSFELVMHSRMWPTRCSGPRSL